MLRNLGAIDQMCYWFSSGNQTSTVNLEVVLREDVDEEILKDAVMRAMQTRSVFRSHPVIVEGRVKVSIDADVMKVPVFAASDKTRKIGTADTYGYLFYFSVQKNELTFHMFHGLTDGMPSLEFLTMVVNYYFQKAKGIHFDPPEPDSPDEFMILDYVMEKSANDNSIGRFEPEEHADEVFHLQEEQFEESACKWRVFEIDVPLLPLLTLTKSKGTSVVPMFEAIIGNAIRKHYVVGDKMIVCFTPVDMRRIFGCDTKHNGSSVVMLPYRAMMDGLDIDKRALLLRRILEFQIRPGNIRDGLKRTCIPYWQAESQPYPIEQIVPMIKWMKVRKKYMPPNTYGLSYAGNVSFLEQVEPYVVSAKANVSGGEVPFMIAAIESKGVVRLMISQSFGDDGLTKTIYREMRDVIPETEFIDCGIRKYDRLDLEDLEHID